MASTPEPTPQAEEAPAGDSLFVTGNAVKEDNFFGRREALKLISGRIGGELQSVSIVANRRMGKTSLLNYVTKRYPQLFPARHTWAFAYMDMMDVRTHTAAGVMRILRRGIAGQLGRDLWDEKYDGNLAVMAEKYEELAEAQVRLVLCLDEWDSVMAHPELNDLIEQLRASGSRSRIGMIVATAHELSDLTARGGLSSPFYNIFEVVYLSLMPEAEWTTLARKMFERGGREASASQIALIGELAGGHPNLTQLAGSVVWDAHSQSWAETQIREVYAHKARPVFQGLWSRQSEVQKDVMRQVLGLKRAASAPKEVWDELKRRGVLTKSGDLFCKPFADFVRSQEPV